MNIEKSWNSPFRLHLAEKRGGGKWGSLSDGWDEASEITIRIGIGATKSWISFCSSSFLRFWSPRLHGLSRYNADTALENLLASHSRSKFAKVSYLIRQQVSYMPFPLIEVEYIWVIIDLIGSFRLLLTPSRIDDNRIERQCGVWKITHINSRVKELKSPSFQT